MHYAIRTIKDPSSVVSGSKIEYEKKPCIAISKGTTVEVYGLDMRLVDIIYPNGYVTLIAPVTFRSSKRFLIVCKGGEYAIMDGKRSIVGGRMATASVYTRCIRTLKNLVFITRSGIVSVATIGNDGLIFGDDVNDFGYYKILDCFSGKNDISFLLEDISGDVFYSRYLMASSKPRMILKEKTLLKKGLVFARPISDGLLLVGRGKAYYYARGKFVLESEFANPGVKNSVAAEGGILLSMEDGEVIRVSLEKRIPFGDGAYSNEDIHEENLYLKAEVLGNLRAWFSVLLHLEGEMYYGGSCSGNSYYLRIAREIKILKTFESNPYPSCLSYSGASFRYTTKRSVKKITYAVDLIAEPKYNLEGVVQRFGMADGALIVSYPNEGKALGGSMDGRSFDEILNIHADNYCCFNTRSHVFCLREKNVTGLEIGDIVLSSFYQGLCAVFTRDRFLKMICLETMECIRSVECPYEVSLLHLSSCLFISTYYDELVIMDKLLRVVHKRRQRVLKSASVVDNRLFFSDMHGVGYEAMCKKEFKAGLDGVSSVLKKLEEEDRWELLDIKPSFFSDCMIEIMVPVGRHIMGIGRSTVFVDTQDFSCYRCSLEGISYGFMADQLYVSIGKSIYKCHLEPIPKIKISTEDRLQGAEPGRAYVLKFSVTSQGKEIIGMVSPVLSIDDEAVINSHLTLKTGGHAYNLLLQDEILMDGRFLTKHYFATVSNLSGEGNLSKLSMFSTKDSAIKLIYESTDEGVVYALDASEDYLVTHRGHTVYVYKRQAQILVELCVMRIDFTPYKIAMHRDRIACSCLYRSFGVFKFNQETNHLSLDFLSSSKDQVESMVFGLGGLIVATTNGKILFLNKDYNIETFSIEDRVTSMCSGTLSLQRSNTIYFTTKDGSVGILIPLNLNKKDLEALLDLERYANELAPFRQDKTSNVIDITMVNNMSNADLESFISTRKYDRDRLVAILSEINSLY
ncbi:cleavage and polyadenylation specificity factor a domain-containing protein [Encephalitozoon hellem]|nr:cleavage and polyadenylation specificity factor a domain-containing protein [Encephalitozoon hellem]